MLPWPVQGLDLILIEHILSITKRKLRALHMYLSNRDASSEQLCKIWSELADSYFNAIVTSMADRYKSTRNSREVLRNVRLDVNWHFIVRSLVL